MLNIFKRKGNRDNNKQEDKGQHEEEKTKQAGGENENGDGPGLMKSLKSGLSRTRRGFIDRVSELFSSYKSLDEELFEELEELLIQADVGIETALKICSDLKEFAEEQDIEKPGELRSLFKEKLTEILSRSAGTLELNKGLNVLMVVGVNGSGKTTTIAKISSRFQNKGKKVLLAAGDTFRAAAIDQLQVWAERLGVKLIAQQEGADAAAVVFDAIQAARSRCVDLLIVDTAGRLHTQKNLMEELKKVKRVIDREAEGASVEVLLVLDATNGQNALNQARFFHEAVEVNGIALTKLDGTAKGGIILAITHELGIPIKLIGVGETAEDLQVFNPDKFVEALFVE